MSWIILYNLLFGNSTTHISKDKEVEQEKSVEDKEPEEFTVKERARYEYLYEKKLAKKRKYQFTV